jgi:hypothetical protein
VFLSCFLLLSQAGWSAEIKVDGDDRLKGIAVTIVRATLKNVLLDLSEKYRFEIKGVEMLNNTDPLSAKMSGSLRSVLEKLMRYCNHCNFMILPDEDNEIGIGKLILLKSPQPAGTS